jgi:hypothetical protein
MLLIAVIEVEGNPRYPEAILLTVLINPVVTPLGGMVDG